jgi:hypothetical protein
MPERTQRPESIRRLSRVWLLGLFLVFPLPAQNILANSSFETWLDTIGVNMPLGWVTSELTHPGSAAKTTDAHTGSLAVELYSADTAAFAATTTLVSPGTSYDFSGFVKTQSLLGGSFVLSWLSLLGSPIGTPALIPILRNTSYHEYARRLVAPDSAAFVVVACVTVLGSTVNVDDVTLTPVSSGIRTGLRAPSQRFYLYPAQTNPFSDYAVINYSLSVGDVALLRIYDLVGNEVRTLSEDYRPAGFYTAFWDGADDAGETLSPGIYFCRLQVGEKTLTQKLILLGE